MTGTNVSTLAALGAGLIATGAAMAVRRERELAVDGPDIDDENSVIAD